MINLDGAGDRDKLVTIRSIAAVETGGRFPTGTPTELAREWMNRYELPGGETFTGDQIAGRFDTVWTMSYREDMDPDLVDVPKTRQLVYRGRAFDIVGASRSDAEIFLRTLASSRL